MRQRRARLTPLHRVHGRAAGEPTARRRLLRRRLRLALAVVGITVRLRLERLLRRLLGVDRGTLMMTEGLEVAVRDGQAWCLLIDRSDFGGSQSFTREAFPNEDL